MIVNAPISVGELIDKITILKIKSILIVDTIKLKNIEQELQLLEELKDSLNIDVDSHTIEIFNYLRPRDHNKQIAISDKSGEVDLYFYHDRSAINTLSKETFDSRGGKSFDIRKIKAETLNYIIENSPFKDNKIDFLTIDVEGYEMNVLKGFDINKYRPSIIVLEFIDNALKKQEFYNHNIQNVINSEVYKYMLSNNYSFVNWIGSDLVFVSNNTRD